jgi:hypothetical protein
VRWPFTKKRDRAAPAKVSSLAELTERARAEVREQAQGQPGWFASLPYAGAMSQEQALEFEAEKRALWRRLIQEAAARPEIRALVWTTREDELVCAECRANHGRSFGPEELDQLSRIPVHLGCRCELAPRR